MPFPDEKSQVAVFDHRSEWSAEFDGLAERLRSALGGLAVAIDHVGSTSVPGLVAKDCVDVQVRMVSIEEDLVVHRLATIGFRCRPEPWNRTEVSGGRQCRKLVFAPPVGARPSNVHCRESDGPNARYALLFRDYLRADQAARELWGAFKRRLAASVPDLLEYGQIKAPATEILMAAAERWATDTGWSVP